MKSLKHVLLAGVILAPTASAQTVVTMGPGTDDWLGFINVFELDCVTFAFNSAWGVPDLTATFDDMAGTVTMTPTPVATGDMFWYVNGTGGPGSAGNKCMDSLLYLESADDPMSGTNPLSGVNLNFTGEILSNTLVAGYDPSVFIRDWDASFMTANEISAPADVGTFSISVMTDPGPARFVQYGVRIIGPNVWPGDEVAAGSVVLGQGFPGSTFADACNGDGGDQMGCSFCPCGNNATPGTVGGCINQSGLSARLLPSGSASVSAADPDDLRFDMTGGNPATLAVLTSGDSLAPQNAANPCFGLGSGVQSVVLDGLRCAVGNTQRHGGRPMDASGNVGLTNNGWGGASGPAPNIAAQGGFVAGQTRQFQVFYRANNAQGCGTGQNTTQAVAVTFEP